MKLEFEIPDDEITEILKKYIADKLLYSKYDIDRTVYGREIKAAVRDVIYSDKANIIDRVVKQASFECRRKALQKMLKDKGERHDN